MTKKSNATIPLLGKDDRLYEVPQKSFMFDQNWPSDKNIDNHYSFSFVTVVPNACMNEYMACLNNYMDQIQKDYLNGEDTLLYSVIGTSENYVSFEMGLKSSTQDYYKQRLQGMMPLMEKTRQIVSRGGSQKWKIMATAQDVEKLRPLYGAYGVEFLKLIKN